ncbi:MAG: ATP-dependent metallopeptidase FtsH/Yme1/Tma family protein [Clostridia bacterium]|nr:ATP-dependent metallopeptidase FtsH/Yme1/Tma family protein [Clostridia bacterium]
MKNKKILILIFAIILIILFIGISVFLEESTEYITYKEFYSELENEKIEKVIIEDSRLQFYKKDSEKLYETENPEKDNLKEMLLLQGVTVETDSAEETFVFIFDLMFYLIFFGAVGVGIYKLVGMNRNTFKVVKHTKIKFEDIAGMDDLKKEMMQIVDILKNSKDYKEKGIRQTKGIIFEGNPGNGKTLFAKALAEEAGVNFIATKGADFQSAVMSFGAGKIKTLFKKAKKYRPCIIFIDEFDGIGERRNYAGSGVDKENNRIITAMLNEMDGFDTEDGILVIAATNSYASLDPALIRPGRFDLKYNISNPDQPTRVKLIDLYTKNKKLSEDINKERLAAAFENLSCSAIETILNEASMLTMLNKKETITLDDIVLAAQKTNCRLNMKLLRK